MICKRFANLAFSLVLGAAASSAPRVAFASETAVLSGRAVDSASRPVSGALLTLRGSGVTLRRSSGADGQFRFPALFPGTYRLDGVQENRQGSCVVEVAAAGAFVTLVLLSTVGHVSVSGGQLPVRGSGTDVTVNQDLLDRMPYQGSLPGALLQLPAAARGANGVVHINGDHGDINYYLDGVQVPQELNREVGSEIDPSDIAFMDVVEGAYPAQYGGRFAAVVNVGTRIGSGPPGASGYADLGSFATQTTYLSAHAPASSGQLSLALAASQGDRFLDPPSAAVVHDKGAAVNAFLRYAVPLGKNYANVTFIHSDQRFEIPNDVAGGEPAATDDSESQTDSFVAVQVHRPLASGGALSYGIGYKQSRIQDFGDPENDFAYGYALSAAGGGSPQDCAKGVVPACAYSLAADRTARDGVVNVDDLLVNGRHTLRYGASYDVTSVDKLYAVTLQPNNFLAPIFEPQRPTAAYTVVDDAPNVGHTTSAYVQDSWQLSPSWLLDLGVRQDVFSLFSTQFRSAFAQTSPRVKVTREYGPRANVYVYFGRFFTPFSLENVSPAAAHLLDLPEQPAMAQFDLRPERDSVFEVGAHLPLGRGTLGLRVMQKIAVDLIDDTQVGVTALHQDVNYAAGNISVQSAYYQQPLPGGGRLYAGLTHARSVNAGCETQLLAPCFGAPAGYTPADHDQNWDGIGGVLSNDRRGGWWALDGEFGSGLSSQICVPPTDDCKVPPHLTFDLVKGIALTGRSVVTVGIDNLFNDRYRITYLNAQGNHYAAGRTLEIGWRFATAPADPQSR